MNLIYLEITVSAILSCLSGTYTYMEHNMKTYGVNVKETEFQPREKQREITDLMLYTGPSIT